MAVKLSRRRPPIFSLSSTVKCLALLVAVTDRCPCFIKRVGPVSSIHSSSTEPAGQNPPLSYQTLGQTPLETGDAEDTHTHSYHVRFHWSASTTEINKVASLTFLVVQGIFKDMKQVDK